MDVGRLSLAFTIAAAVIAAVWLTVSRTPDRVSEVVPATRNIEPSNHSQLPLPPSNPEIALLGSASSMSSTARSLVLVATEPGRTAHDGRASLGTDVRNPQTYAAGAILANGAVLEEIYADYVILSRDGKRSILAVAGVDPNVLARHRSLSFARDELLVGGDESLKRPLERVASSRIDLSDIIRAEPLFEHDEFSGLRILPGTDKSKLAALELQSGDIVRSIDGKRVKSPDEAWQLLDDAISTSTPIVVSIDREGSLLSISLDGSRLNEPTIQMTSSETLPASPGS